MFNFKRILGELGWDGWTFLLCGVAALVVAVLDFAQVITLTSESALRLVIVAIGMVLGAIAAQTSRRTAEIKDLRDAVGVTSIELIRVGKESQLHVQQSLSRAKRFVLDTTLHRDRANLNYPTDDRTHYHYTMYERLQKREISYRKVEGIFSKERLEYVISRLLIYEGTDYLIRYYASTSKPIPVLNMMSIDNEAFYLGAFYRGDAPAETENLAYSRDPRIGTLLSAYWNNLWQSAKPLNEEGRIDWDELKAIASFIGMSEQEFDATVNKWKDEVQRRKRHPR